MHTAGQTRARARLRVLAAAGVLAGSLGCTAQEPALERPSAAPSPAPVTPAPSAPAAASPELPPGGLRDLVPTPTEVPAGLVPLLQASGPRDSAAVAGFSSDPGAAAQSLTARGFTDAYVAQYAAPGDPRTLTVVVVRFATADGARADLEADLAESAGDVVPAAQVGEASQVRRVTLPEDDGLDLVTVRFQVGTTTWLLAWRAPVPADAEVPLALARELAARA